MHILIKKPQTLISRAAIPLLQKGMGNLNTEPLWGGLMGLA